MLCCVLYFCTNAIAVFLLATSSCFLSFDSTTTPFTLLQSFGTDVAHITKDGQPCPNMLGVGDILLVCPEHAAPTPPPPCLPSVPMQRLESLRLLRLALSTLSGGGSSSPPPQNTAGCPQATRERGLATLPPATRQRGQGGSRNRSSSMTCGDVRRELSTETGEGQRGLRY